VTLAAFAGHPSGERGAVPWQERNVVKLGEEFVLSALKPGANITELCGEYGISRKTGYKWLNRFKERGRGALEDMSRRPHSSPLRATGDAVFQVVELRSEHPRWGPRKLHAVLGRSMSPKELPSVRTIARIVERAGLVKKRRRSTARKAEVTSTPAPEFSDRNDLWTVDFKGWWRTRDGAMARWRDGAMARWRDGAMARWRDGAMARVQSH
jgi:putative transposase